MCSKRNWNAISALIQNYWLATEWKLYFRGKHNSYGYLVELSILQIRIAINATSHYAVSVSDLDILIKQLLRSDCESKNIHNDDLLEYYKHLWALSMDKTSERGARKFARTNSHVEQLGLA